MDCCPAALAISLYLASEPIPIRACFTDLKQTHCQLFLQQKWVCCRISKELHYGVCNHQGDPQTKQGHTPHPPTPCSPSPEWQGKTGKGSWEGYSKQRVHSFHWLSCCQERRGVFLPLGGCCCCNLMYQTFRGFLLGTTWDYSSTLWWWWLLLWCLGVLCPVQSITDPLSIPGRCSLQVFSPLSRGQYWEFLWLVHGHITRKWQSLDSNTGRFPNEAHQVPFCFWLNFFKLWEMRTT